MEFHASNHNSDPQNASISGLEKADVHVAPLKEDQPRTPFPSILKLTREQEDALVDLALKHYEAMDKELCRSETDTTGSGFGEEWFAAEENQQKERTDNQRRLADSFFGKRLLYDLTFRNKLAWRKTVIGGIFNTSNMTLATSRRIAMQRIARFTRYFFETRPWFITTPQGRSDKQFADKLARYADWKLHDSASASEFRKAIKTASVINEGVLKITRAVDDDYYEEELEVMVAADGNPIIASDGDYITRDDLWIPDPGAMQAAQDAGALPGNPGVITEVLERDLNTSKRGYEITTKDGVWNSTGFEPQLVERRTVHYSGAKSSLVYYRDFMCPLGAADIFTAPCIAHLYSIEASELAGIYAANQSPETIRQAVDLIGGAIRGNIVSNASDVSKPRLSAGETIDNHSPDPVPRLEVAEFYLKADPKGTGITRDIMLVVDLKTRIPLYYNYTAVVSPTRRRPFQVIREAEVEGRWFGQGTMERFEEANTLIDLFLNRIVICQSRAGRVDFFAASDTVEGANDPHLRINGGETYTPLPGKDPAKILQSVFLHDNKADELRATLELLNQAATNESGTASANDSAAAGLDTSQLATGINNIQAAGNELTSLPIMELKDGLSSALSDFVATTYRFHDETEAFTYFEGDVPVELRFSKKEVSTLNINVQILMTTLLTERQLPGKRAALVDAERYYAVAATNPIAAEALASGYREVLKGAGFDNADSMIATGQSMPTIGESGSVSEPGNPNAQ